MKRAFVIGALLVVLTLSLGGSVASKGTDNGATYEQLRLFTEVLSIVQNQYVDEVPPKELIYRDRKSTRLNSSHGYISYAVFCLKKKKNKKDNRTMTEVTYR